MILPGETQLNLQTNVREIDYDFLYGVFEDITNAYDTLSNRALTVSTEVPGTYHITTSDWRGVVTVGITDYPAFDVIPSSVKDWALYD
jgi:hypothetical protein